MVWMHSAEFAHDDELFLAGHRVPAGTYKRLGDGVIVRLEQDDVLPATLDGRVACYAAVRANGQPSQQEVRH